MPRVPPAESPSESLRRAIAGWIGGVPGGMPSAACEHHGLDAVLSAVEREGVVSLVHAAFAGMPADAQVPAALREALAERARHAAGRSMLALAEARRIQRALDDAGIRGLWMKGVALAHWLYPERHLRDFADIDLLLPDHATTLQGARVLEPLGYLLPNPHIAGDLVVHELLAWSQRAQLELDLHWDTSNDALFAERLAWDALAADSIALPDLAPGARGFSRMHGLLHASMHRAANYRSGRENRLRWLHDIHLLAGGLSTGEWAALPGMAQRLELAGPCLDALEASRAWFATPLPAAALEALSGAAESELLRCERLRSWGYFQGACWRALPDTAARLRWLRQVVLPDMAHLRVRYGGDGAGQARVVARRMMDGWSRWRGYHRAHREGARP